MAGFVPGLELSRRFYEAAIRPVLAARFPRLPHAAARVGWGSEVLGFDDATSTDHNWGPSVQLVLRQEDAGLADEVRRALDEELPVEFAGFPVRFAPADTDEAPRHWVEATTVRALCRDLLAHDLDRPVEPADWLTFPSQKLLALTAGAVYHDGPGELTALRVRLAWYPRDVWIYLLATGWRRIGQEEHLAPRAGQAGDELGSALIGSRLVRDVMRLCFLMERRYAPYPKWFGTAFARLDAGPALVPILRSVQLGPTWQERQAALARAFERLARMHNGLGLTAPMPEEATRFYGRPFTVIDGSTFADALLGAIADPTVNAIAARRPIGGIDQISDNTDVLEDTAWRPILRRLYE